MNPVELAITIFTALKLVLGFFGNSLVIISVKKFEWLRSPTFYFVALLAFFDLCITIPAFVFLTPIILKGSPTDNVTLGYEIGCKFVSGLIGFAGTGNLLCIIVIAVDRYLYITKPLRYMGIVTLTKCLVISAFVLLFPFGLSLNQIRSDVDKPCTTHKSFNKSIVKYLIVPLFCFGLVIVIVLYGKIAYVSWKARNLHLHPLPRNNQTGSQNKITKFTSLVIGVFMVTYITYFVTFQLTRNRTGEHIVWIQRIVGWIWMVS